MRVGIPGNGSSPVRFLCRVVKQEKEKVQTKDIDDMLEPPNSFLGRWAIDLVHCSRYRCCGVESGSGQGSTSSSSTFPPRLLCLLVFEHSLSVGVLIAVGFTISSPHMTPHLTSIVPPSTFLLYSCPFVGL